MKNHWKRILFPAALASSSLMAGCEDNVGMGLNVGIPVGDHGYVSVRTGRWY